MNANTRNADGSGQAGHSWPRKAPGSTTIGLGLALALGLLLAACGGTGGGGGGTAPAGEGDSSSLAAVEPIPPGDECPSGGQRIYYGIDSNNNGVLDDSERDGYEVICHGLGAVPNPMEPPAAPEAQFTLNLDGGDSNADNGGDGGRLELSFTSGSDTGHILVFGTGEADASFVLPDPVVTHLGDVPMIVASDLTVATYDTSVLHPSGLDPGEFHLHNGDYLIYVANAGGDGDEPYIVSGIRVEAGATLTFEANLGTSAYVSVPEDVHNLGTITVDKPGYDTPGLGLYMRLYHGAAGSRIDVTGLDYLTADASGGHGGFLNLYATRWPQGGIYNESAIDTSGGDGGASGGVGGPISLNSFTIFNTGNLTAVGGAAGATVDGIGGTGGAGGTIELKTETGSLYNAGALDASGGTGDNGGMGGYIGLVAAYGEGPGVGNLVNSGNLTGNGGTGTNGDGGHSTGFSLTAYGGSVINSGDLTFRGGDGTTNGGSGPEAGFQTRSGIDWWLGYPVPAGDVIVSGNIDLSGGDGDANFGGAGGWLYPTVDPGTYPAGQNLVLLGYSLISANGGDSGAYDGGGAGAFSAAQAPSYHATGIYGPGGAVVNYVDVQVMGGDANTGGAGFGYAGHGGMFAMRTDQELYLAFATWRMALNFGDVNLSGGDGDTGGHSGPFYLFGYDGAENRGALTTAGGTASGAEENAGNSATAGEYAYGPPGVNIYAPRGAAVNTGIITATGGRSDGPVGYGGNGASVEIVGYSAEVGGSIVASGGGASDPGYGGNGGWIFILGQVLGTSDSATYTHDAGVGGTEDGLPGGLMIDGMNVGGTDWPIPE